MINSTSPSDRTAHTNPLAAASPQAGRPHTIQPDRLAIDRLPQLRQALMEQPEIRPEVVERGRQLAADPSYPSTQILRQVGTMLLAAPDLSEDNS